ncbi:MAG: twin-arginine translocase TatA/TatE family subunit [Chromatiales bacterium]|jgi:sec-independent protein translocase protein TatA|nr:twin-arginine translocase TatA/TatE family subunit [Chromatiales bacterium]
MGPSWVQMLIVLVIVLLIFGTKKLRNAGGDLGGAIRNFKSAMKSGNKGAETADPLESPDQLENGSTVIDGEATKEKDKV